MLADLIQEFKTAIEAELQREISNPLFQSYPGLEPILRYHLGFENEAGQGKRVRPLIVLLSVGAVNGDWRCALPSAAAVELLHNFSLIHDDIEDGSPLRRGRETVWKKWGIPLAINAGDAMFTLAFSALVRLKDTLSPDVSLRSLQVLTETSLRLTCGQHLDIAHETERSIEMDTYWAMVAGKTAALLSACSQLGAIAGRATAQQEKNLAQFGHFLGLAFQAWDDWLGIWGDPLETGKSTDSDLVAGKKTLPVVYALQHSGRFSDRWNRGAIQPDEVGDLSTWLADVGAKEFTEIKVTELTSQAIDALHAVGCDNEYVQGLEELALSLVKRKK
jgi:geranylgeranyl diphosphate synthase type I